MNVWFCIVSEIADRISTPNSVTLFVGLAKSDVYKKWLDTRQELIAGILDAAARKNKRENQLRRTTRDFRTRVAKRVEADGGIFDLLRTATNL